MRAGRVPRDLVIKNESYLPAMIGFTPPRGVYAHIIGTDLVRTAEDTFYVLEDNLRTPSGVSYMLENRETMMRLFPELFTRHRIASVETYPLSLHETLASVAPPACSGEPNIVVLSPGIHNSAFFEHAFLADQMGVDLVFGTDLFIEDGWLFMRTTEGRKKVDVIYRRIDDDFLDPLTFRPDSMLGVGGIFDLYRAGRVTIVNGPGTGIADDKAIYSYVPDIIEFYTGQKPLIENVPTWRCSEADSLAYVLDHLDELVVKEVHGSGGYGMLVGPTATKREIAGFAKKLAADPANYIAQPTLAPFDLSGLYPRRRGAASRRLASLRPGRRHDQDYPRRFDPGGPQKGSLVVNSSQGGGTKDTWVLED